MRKFTENQAKRVLAWIFSGTLILGLSAAFLAKGGSQKQAVSTPFVMQFVLPAPQQYQAVNLIGDWMVAEARSSNRDETAKGVVKVMELYKPESRSVHITLEFEANSFFGDEAIIKTGDHVNISYQAENKRLVVKRLSKGAPSPVVTPVPFSPARPSTQTRAPSARVFFLYKIHTLLFISLSILCDRLGWIVVRPNWSEYI